jgi:phage terminase small subunit
MENSLEPQPKPPADARHRLFAEILFRGSSYVDAYLKAGFQCTRATAYVNGHRLRWKPEVANYIAALQRWEREARERAREAESAAWSRTMRSKLMR